MKATTCCGTMDSLIRSFRPVTRFEKDCFQIATSCLNLWRSYPNADFFKHASLPDDESDDCDEDYVAMDEYISFIASTNDIISDSLLDIVNNDFNERAGCQELKIITIFNETKPGYTNELAYGQSVLELIHDLCTLLNRKL